MSSHQMNSTMSIEDLKAVDKLRTRVMNELEPEMEEDTQLFLRFLRARDFNLDQSEVMLRKHLAWRKTIQIQKVKQDFKPPTVMDKYFPYTKLGSDKDGAPLRYFHFGGLDGKGLHKSCRKANIIKSVLFYLEQDCDELKQQSQKLGKSIEQWSYLFNFENVGLAQATDKSTIEILIAIAKIYEANYPERLKAAYVVNASVYFTLLFAVVKPLLSGSTLKKVKIFGRDNWKEEVLKLADPEVLPVFLGGNRTDSNGNPLCTDLMNYGGKVPEDYYIKKQDCSLAMDPKAKKFTVGRLSKYTIHLEVTDPASYIEWEFESKNKDIGFGIIYKESESKVEEVVPKQRIEAHMSSEAGAYKCHKAGNYTLVFDNTYSWLQHKEIFCKTAVVTPLEQRISASE